MQTFIASYNLEENAARLDGKRLFKQILEGKQILNVLANKKTGAWSNHPACNQWRGFEAGLYFYIQHIWFECQRRGIALNSQLFNQCGELISKLHKKPMDYLSFPRWWGREDILISHRSRLKCKGLVDVTCAAIKKQLKIKSIDKWLKENFKKTKNQLKYDDLTLIRAMTFANGVSFQELNNHYDLPEWKDIPYNLEYVWGVNGIDNKQ